MRTCCLQSIALPLVMGSENHSAYRRVFWFLVGGFTKPPLQRTWLGAVHVYTQHRCRPGLSRLKWRTTGPQLRPCYYNTACSCLGSEPQAVLSLLRKIENCCYCIPALFSEPALKDGFLLLSALLEHVAMFSEGAEKKRPTSALKAEPVSTALA